MHMPVIHQETHDKSLATITASVGQDIYPALTLMLKIKSDPYLKLTSVFHTVTSVKW